MNHPVCPSVQMSYKGRTGTDGTDEISCYHNNSTSNSWPSPEMCSAEKHLKYNNKTIKAVLYILYTE